MDKVEKKRQKEQHVVEEMIRLYCRKKHPKEDRQAGGSPKGVRKSGGLDVEVAGRREEVQKE